MANDDLSIRVEGSESLDALARTLKKLGDGGEIKKRLAAALREAGRPAAEEMRDVLAARLPKRGGASKAFTRKKKTFSVRNRMTSSKTNAAGVRIQSADRERDYGTLEDKGILRHPVFPDHSRPRKSWRWVEQKVPTKGVLEEAFLEHSDDMIEAVADAMVAAAREVEQSIERGV